MLIPKWRLITRSRVIISSLVAGFTPFIRWGVSASQIFLFRASLCKRENYQPFYDCLRNYLIAPDDQERAGATYGIKVASEAAFKRDVICNKFEKEI
jgi:hypothetical protein